MQRRILLAAAALLPSLATAQTPPTPPDWPARPVRMLVGSAPGGGTDAMARAVADRLAPLLRQPVIVENRPGVSNTLAVDMTAKSTDGHTMVMGVVTAHAIAPHLLKLGYDSNRDLVPVAYVGAVPNVLVVGNNLPANSVQELVALARKEPGRINFASSGTGSTQHIAAEMFKDAAGIELTHVPYKGSAAALVDLVSGQVQMSFDTMPSVIGQIKAGKLRPLGVTSPRRNAQLPQVPTLAEAGLPGVEIGAWYGIYMPAAHPAPCRPGCTTKSTRCWPCPRRARDWRPWAPSCSPWARRSSLPCTTPSTSALAKSSARTTSRSTEPHMPASELPVVALTLGDPAGIGAELIARLLARPEAMQRPTSCWPATLAVAAGPAHRGPAGGHHTHRRHGPCTWPHRHRPARLPGPGHGGPDAVHRVVPKPQAGARCCRCWTGAWTRPRPARSTPSALRRSTSRP